MRTLAFKVILVVLVTALVGGVAYAYSKSQPREFQSSAQLEFGRLLAPDLQVLGTPGDPQIDEEVRINTEAASVDSFDVARATERRAPQLGYNARQIHALVNATAVRSTLVVKITAIASSPRRANRLANSYAEAYVRLRRQRDATRARTGERALRARLSSLPSRGARGPIGATIRNQISALGVLRRVGSGSPQIIERAQATGAAAKPQTRRNVLFGIVFGLVAGLGLVALRSPAGRTRGAAVVQSDAPSPSEPPVFR